MTHKLALALLVAVAGCGSAPKPIQPLGPAATLRGPLVVLAPDAEIWGRDSFAEALASDSSLADLFRARLERDLRDEVQVEGVRVQPVPASLALSRQPFRVDVRGRATYPRLDLPAPGTTIQTDGLIPAYVVFLNRLELKRVRRATGLPNTPGAVPGAPPFGGVSQPGDLVNGVEWRASVTLWDNETGAPVRVQTATGWGAIGDGRSTFFRGDVSAETWAEAVRNLAAAIAEALPAARGE